METITLQCWVYRDDVENVFPVEIPKDKTVGVLKEIIKDKKFVSFRGVEADKLRLYSIRIPGDDDEHLGDELKRLSLEDKLRLNSRTKVSKLFPKSDEGEEDWLIVVDRPNSAGPSVAVPDMTLNCWVRGQHSSRVFSVEISSTKTVFALKKAIRNEKPVAFCDVDADTLTLYKVSLPFDANIEKTLVSLTLCQEESLQPTEPLSNCFRDVPRQGHIHIVVDAHLSDDRTTVPQVREQDDVITSLAESFKLATTIGLKSLTPSVAAKSTEYAKIQSGPLRMLDCRCAARNIVNTVAPPIQLFNPAFAYFSSNAFDPEYNVPNDFVRNVRDLVAQFGLIHTNEEARRLHLRSVLADVIDYPLVCINNFDKTAPDFVALSHYGARSVYLIIGEEKNEFGEGGSDPSVQASFSFQRIFSQQENSELCLRCCCPAFIVAHAGPYLTIMGGIINADCVVQRLTDFLWVPVHSTHDDNQYHRISRILHALKESIRQLDSWYKKTIKDVKSWNPTGPTLHPRFFPSPDTYSYNSTLVRFAYQKPLEQNVSCVTYLAETLEDHPKQIVVKFVTSSYGVEAHQEMASTGFAPKLLYYGPINVTPDMPSYGDLRMVVMGYVEGTTLEKLIQSQVQVPSECKDGLRRAFAQLHDAGYVFGDLRPPNVIIPAETSTVQLIDFDWAGKEGNVRYPIALSSSIQWAPGIKGLELVRKEHDLAMLDLLISQCGL